MATNSSTKILCCFIDFTWGSVPALEVRGKGVLLQSIAITRYVAKQFDLTGADDFEAARCDEYADALKDLGAGKGT
jgi:glutathione S-transferase